MKVGHYIRKSARLGRRPLQRQEYAKRAGRAPPLQRRHPFLREGCRYKGTRGHLKVAATWVELTGVAG